MIYLIGLIGFVIGFAVGQGVLYFLLADRPKEELENNKNLRRQYGLLNWAIALAGTLTALHFFG